MMMSFVIIAGILAAGAAVLLIVPLIRRRADVAGTAAYSAVVALFALLLGSAALYAAWSKYEWIEASSIAETPAAMTAKLARRLAEKPPSADDIGDWLKLGRSYEVLGQGPLAIRAYQRADRLANGTNVFAIFGVADLLLAQDPEEFRGPAGKLYERALELAPNSDKALFGAGMTALSRGDTALARTRMTRILDQNPPANVRQIIEKFLASIDAQGVAGGAAPAAAADGPRVSVHVTLAPALAAKVPAEAALFVAARDPKSPGPPFAVKRLAAKFPVDVELTTADAMLASRSIAPGQKLDIVARVALGGTPTASSGDPYGQVGYHVGRDGRLNIVIDKLAP